MTGATTLLVVAGLALLAVGGELLVRAASRLAAVLGIPPLVIGLTVVAFGTSLPELAVSLQAAAGGRPEIAAANVVGSNILNVLLILGASALVAPLVVSRGVVRRETPLMVLASLLAMALGADGRLGTGDGLALLAGLAAYAGFCLRQGIREGRGAARPADPPPGRGVGVLVQIALLTAGLLLLVVGARWLVDGAVAAARALGVSEMIIGLTLVAVGTSLPEIATSMVAAARGEREIAVGNVVGSNMFNLLGILGVAAVAVPGGLTVAPALLRFDLPVMTAAAVACLPVFFTGYRISRWEGALFLAYYGAYAAYLILHAAEHDALPAYSAIMLWFALPLTAATLVAIVVRERRARRHRRAGV